jgi:phosphatidate cytidylyltransferase
MLRTRLWMGTLLAGAALALLLLDHPPWFPGLLVLLLILSLACCRELVTLLGAKWTHAWLCYAGPAALVLANWLPQLLGVSVDPWRCISGTLALLVAVAFLNEMASFQEPGTSVVRIAITVWVTCYLGLLPCFLAQLRFLPGEPPHGTAALLLAVFVPKCCDIGAYFTGRLLGRHRMTPVLSPKKTWEGAAGGLVAAVIVTFLLNHYGPKTLLDTWWQVIGFGLTVGVAGMFGDLAESLIKRDCRRKDADVTVPGFGGVLDVVDAVLFAAPVAFVWLR